MPITADDIWGSEHDWIGIDEDGHVAMFSTAGGGYASASYLRDPEAHERAIASLLELPVIATPVGTPLKYPFDVWERVVERGLYVFDSDPTGLPYKRIGVPSAPIHVSQLSLLDDLKGAVLRGLRFAVTDTLTQEMLVAADRAAT